MQSRRKNEVNWNKFLENKKIKRFILNWHVLFCFEQHFNPNARLNVARLHYLSILSVDWSEDNLQNQEIIMSMHSASNFNFWVVQIKSTVSWTHPNPSKMTDFYTYLAWSVSAVFGMVLSYQHTKRQLSNFKNCLLATTFVFAKVDKLRGTDMTASPSWQQVVRLH